jgi:hypothetical protein
MGPVAVSMVASATAIAVNLDSRGQATERADGCGNASSGRRGPPTYVTRSAPGRVRAQITQIAIAIISSDQNG